MSDQPNEQQTNDALSETVKVGDAEYTQDELNRFVGLGKMADELESKWNTKIDRLMPEYTKTTQELKSLREEKNQWEAERSKPVTQGRQQSREELVKQARAEAKELGLATVEDFEAFYQERRAGEKLLDETNKVVDSAKAEGKPAVEVMDLLRFMADNQIKNPEVAYKVMKEEELDVWKESKLKELKPRSIHTQHGSTAGSKQPTPVVPTRDNLRELLKERFAQGEN